jgi:hypothetical protein
MGNSHWSDDFYAQRAAHRAATGESAFAYSDSLRNAPPGARKTHPRMNPFRVGLRESRDSATHPTSRAVAVLFDVTGSMGTIPVILQQKLPSLMNLLLQKHYLDHPQILFGAIGDATCDRAPLQIGQFESGIEMDEDLGRIFLEGGGGGQTTESYELAAYFMATHTALDCFEKRGEKGYLFIIGDEQPYPAAKHREIERIIGDAPPTDLPTAAVFKALQRTYEVFHILPAGSSNAANPAIQDTWQRLLGQNVLHLDDPAAVCEAIALTIGLCEGKADLHSGIDDLRNAGATATTARSVSTALATLAKPARRALPAPTATDGFGFLRRFF